MSTSGNEYRGDVHSITQTLEIELPTSSKKKYSIPIMLDSFSHPLIIQIHEAGKTILTESVNLRSHYVNKKLGIVVAERTSEADPYMFPDELHPVTINPQYLPESWFGYDGVDMLIMQAHILEILNDRQYLAMVEWLKRGGYIIFTSGLHPNTLTGERLQSILPMTVMGFGQLSEVGSMESFCGQRFTSSDPFLFVKSGIDNATILLHEKDSPLIALKDMALGKIIFMAFDVQALPFRRWEGRKDFWMRIFTLRTDLDNVRIELDTQAVSKGLISAIPSRFPDIFLSIIVGVLYLISIIYLFTRINKKMKVRIKTFPLFFLIIGLFILAALWFYFFKTSQKSLTFNHFVYLKKGVTHDPMISYRQIMGLYALKNTTLAFNMDLDLPPLIPVVAQNDEDGFRVLHDMIIKISNSQYTGSVFIPNWSYGFLASDSITYMPFDGTVLKEKNLLTLSWTNPTSHNIIDCHVYYQGRVSRISPMKASSRGEIKISILDMQEVNQFKRKINDSWILEKSETSHELLLETMKRDLLEDIISKVHTRYHSRPQILCLLGWMGSSVLSYHFYDPAPKGEQVTFFEWEIKVDEKEI